MTLTSPKDSVTPSASRRSSRRTIVGVGLALGLGVPVAVEGRHQRAAAVQVELAHLVGAARGACRSRPRGPSSGRAPPRSSRAARPRRRRRSRSCPARPSAARPPPPGSRRGAWGRRCSRALARAAGGRLRSSPGALEHLGVGLPARAEELGVLGAERALVGGAEQVRAVDQRALVVEDRRLDRAARGSPRGGGRRTGRARPRRPRTRPGPARRGARRAPTSGAARRPCPGSVTTTAASSSPMSMPSSSASVVITARSSPARQPPLELAPLLGGVAGAVGGDQLRQLGVACPARSCLTSAAQHLDALARLHEADRARALADELGQQLGGLAERRAARAQLARRSAAGSTRRSAAAAPASRPRRSAPPPRGPSGARPARRGLAIVAEVSRKRGSVP